MYVAKMFLKVSIFLAIVPISFWVVGLILLPEMGLHSPTFVHWWVSVVILTMAGCLLTFLWTLVDGDVDA